MPLLVLLSLLTSFLYFQVKRASRQAGVATASMGKFDKRLEGEKPGDRRIGSTRRKFDPAFADMANERTQVALFFCTCNFAFSKVITGALATDDYFMKLKYSHMANESCLDLLQENI